MCSERVSALRSLIQYYLCQSYLISAMRVLHFCLVCIFYFAYLLFPLPPCHQCSCCFCHYKCNLYFLHLHHMTHRFIVHLDYYMHSDSHSSFTILFDWALTLYILFIPLLRFLLSLHLHFWYLWYHLLLTYNTSSAFFFTIYLVLLVCHLSSLTFELHHVHYQLAQTFYFR